MAHGNWYHSRAAAGRDPPEKLGLDAIVFAEAKEFDGKAPKDAKIFECKINPAKSPKTLDAIAKDDRTLKTDWVAKTEWVGIYRLDGDTLTLCVVIGGGGGVGDKNRPTEFKTGTDNSGRLLLELKRRKKALDTPMSDNAKAELTRTNLRNLTKAVQAYQIKYGALPAKLEDLLMPPDGSPSLIEPSKDVLKDQWDHAYNYDPKGPKNNGKQPDIWSEGPPGKKRPVGNWEPLKERGKKE
jgi:uncharacterized protein (TIGR03067 family)